MKETNRSCWLYTSKWQRTKTDIQGGPKEKIREMKECRKWSTNRQKWNTEDLRTLLYKTVQFYPSLKNTSPDSSEFPLIMTSEVKKTLKGMKNNKAPGIDNLTSDVMILEGEESVKQITCFIYLILETKKKKKKRQKERHHLTGKKARWWYYTKNETRKT